MSEVFTPFKNGAFQIDNFNIRIREFPPQGNEEGTPNTNGTLFYLM